MRIEPLVFAVEYTEEDKKDEDKTEWFRKKLMDEYEKDVFFGDIGSQHPIEGTP